jgi:DNA-binding response OmpR family regulator
VVLRVRKLLLEHEGYSVLTAAGAELAEELLRTQPVDLVLLDYGVAEAQRVAARIRRLQPGLHIVLISFSPSFPETLTGVVDGWVSKTRSPDVLLHKIEQLLGTKRKSARRRPASRR